MKITIITPCGRPDKLPEVIKSINFNKIYKWIIVYDELITKKNINQFNHPQIKEYTHTSEGVSGNPQRNFGLDQIEDDDTFVYFLDDDNIIHPNFYEIIPILKKNKIYTFDQQGTGLLGNVIENSKIDTAQFLYYYKFFKSIKWNLMVSGGSDFQFINDCITLRPKSHIYINKLYCYYNWIR
jgi:hypothetical protein